MSVLKILFACCLLLPLGCVSSTYHYGLSRSEASRQPISRESQARVNIGGPSPRLDRIESVVQSPRRLLRKVFRRPEISPTTELHLRTEATQEAERFLSANGISDIDIDVRVYDPKLQWQRLRSNDQISPVWKYTGGTASWLRYTLLPMRAFRTDHYDPYSKTLHLNSARPMRSLFEAASVKEHERQRQIASLEIGSGTYAMLHYVPFVPLLHDAKTSSDLLTYANENLGEQADEELYPTVYSQLGRTAVSEALSVVSLTPDAPFFTEPLLRVGGSIAGRLVGRVAFNQQSPLRRAMAPSAARESKVEITDNENLSSF